MKNFPTKTFASRRNKKAAQGHKSVPTSGPRGQAGGPGGGDKHAHPGVRNARREIRRGAGIPTNAGVPGDSGHQQTPPGRRGFGVHAAPTRGQQGPGEAGTPRGHCLSVLKNAERLAFCLEASLGKFTERKQTRREDGSMAGSLLFSKPRT